MSDEPAPAVERESAHQERRAARARRKRPEVVVQGKSVFVLQQVAEKRAEAARRARERRARPAEPKREPAG